MPVTFDPIGPQQQPTKCYIPAGTSTDTVVKATSGNLIGIVVSTVGTAASVLIYDGTKATGNVLGALPANTPIGFYPMGNAPALTSITVGGAAGNPSMTILFQ